MRISDWSSDVCSSDLPLNTAYRSAEVEYFLTDAEPSVAVCDSKNLEWIEALAKKTNIANVYTLDADGGRSLAVAAASKGSQFQTVHSHPDAIATLPYPSGPNDRSKGSILQPSNIP